MRPRVLGCLAASALIVLALACGDDGGDDGPRVERDEAVSILLQQGYTSEGAECIIENADRQDVDLTSVYARDAITQYELGVLASVQEFCLDKFPMATTPGTGAESITTPTAG
jgi:hypothetical protein